MIKTASAAYSLTMDKLDGIWKTVVQWLPEHDWGDVHRWSWWSLQDGTIWLKNLAWAWWKSMTAWISSDCIHFSGEIFTTLFSFILESECTLTPFLLKCSPMLLLLAKSAESSFNPISFHVTDQFRDDVFTWRDALFLLFVVNLVLVSVCLLIEFIVSISQCFTRSKTDAISERFRMSGNGLLHVISAPPRLRNNGILEGGGYISVHAQVEKGLQEAESN